MGNDSFPFGWLLMPAIAGGALAGLAVRMLGPRRRPPAATAVAPVDLGSVEVTREQAPALFAAVGEVAAALGVSPVRRILITEDMGTVADLDPNAGLLQVGLLMLAAFPPDEARADIAQALAPQVLARGTNFRLPPGENPRHLYGKAREQAWRQVLEEDALVARLAGVQATARAMVRTEALSWYSEQLVRDLVVHAIDHPEPPFTGEFTYHCQMMANASLEGRIGRWLTAQMDPPEDEYFTPWRGPVGPRLRALGVTHAPPEALRPAERTAASEWLGDALAAEIAATFDARPDGYIQTEWPRWHREAQEEQVRLAALDARAAEGTLTLDEALDRAWMARLQRRPDAVELYAALADASPVARFELGCLLLERGDDAGILQLERLAGENPDYAYHALKEVAAYLQETGRGAQARDVRQRLHAIIQASAAEREARERKARRRI